MALFCFAEPIKRPPCIWVFYECQRLLRVNYLGTLQGEASEMLTQTSTWLCTTNWDERRGESSRRKLSKCYYLKLCTKKNSWLCKRESLNYQKWTIKHKYSSGHRSCTILKLFHFRTSSNCKSVLLGIIGLTYVEKKKHNL